MKEGPDVSIVAALIGDPARANMLMALMSGLALSGTELAAEAGVTLSTASGHLAKLERAGLVAASKQGRTRYFRFADPDVAAAVEGLIPIATRVGHLRSRPGPRDQAMRQARSCYDHLAGRLAVALLDRWLARRVLSQSGATLQLTPSGRRRLERLGVDVAGLEQRQAADVPDLHRLERTAAASRRRTGRRHPRPRARAALGGARGTQPRRAFQPARGAELRALVLRGVKGTNGTRSRRVTRGSRPATASLKCAVVSCAAHPAAST